MRPACLEDVVGQVSALGPGTPLRRMLDPGVAATNISVILWGPPGTGKTTLATLVSAASGLAFTELSAVTAGVKDVREVIERARDRLSLNGQGTVLFIDEVHRFSKSQQDALLPAVENGWVTLIAATTENPSFSVISPLLSRSVVVTLTPLDDAAIRTLVERAVRDPRGLDSTWELDPQACGVLVRMAAGDARRALTFLEAASAGVEHGGTITVAALETAIQHVAVRYDKDGDQHYDVISAFIKSVRGSDPDAALHYLARMLEAGEDPRFIARRLMILASEDIGMADPSVLQTTVAAASAVAMIGMPEARIILAHATVHAAMAPKSNAVITGIDAAVADVRSGLVGSVPPALRDAHYPGARDLGHGAAYIYPHNEPGGVARQVYLPEVLADRRYYLPTDHGAESRWAEILEAIVARRSGVASGDGSDS